MGLNKFLSLCAMILGVIAAIFLSKLLFANANKLLHATFHYSPVGWPSSEIISSMASQKADTLASVILVFLSLGLQLSTIFIRSDIQFAENLKSALIISIALVAVITIVVQQVNIGAKKSFEIDIKKQAARDYLQSTIERMSCPLYRDIEAIAEQYFNFKKEPEDANDNFIKGFAKYIGYHLPSSVDFLKFK